MKGASFNTLLNVGKKEWPRILLSWSLHLFLRVGFVVGWTVTIAMFITRVGIEFLPHLLVVNALLMIVGSVLYSKLLRTIKKPLLILYTTLSGAGLLLIATLFSYSSPLTFFGLILAAQSILLAQLHILISLFTEDLFSPLESQRTFPIIASSETLGGIIGGLIVGLLASVLPSYKFIYLWILILTLIIPTLLTSHVYSRKMPSLKVHKVENRRRRHQSTPLKRMKTGFKKILEIPFLKGIMIVVMLQFMLFNLLEFQYAKAIEEAIHADVGSEAIFEGQLTKTLGTLQFIFSAGSLVIQMFVASRVISSLGIVGSLIIHPLVTLFHIVGMIWRFNFFTAAIGRSSFEITGGIFRNAYHSSYYALSENVRDQVKEFLEGFIKPIGAIIAFGLYFIVQSLTHGEQETLILNLIMLGIAILMTIRLIPLQKNYTQISYQNLEKGDSLPTRLNAIEIMGQKGHTIASKVLVQTLRRKEEPVQIRLKILETLRVKQDPNTIPEILECLKAEEGPIRLAAIETLNSFENLKEALGGKAFTRHRAIEQIKTLFQVEESADIRSHCIQILAKIDRGDLIPFIISTMTSGKERIKSACIKACGNFDDENIVHYIKGYLESENPHIRAETIQALWKFEKFRKPLSTLRDKMKKSDDPETILSTLYLLGKIGNSKDLAYLKRHLRSSDKRIHEEATKSLCKLNHPASIPHIVQLITSEDRETAERMKNFVKGLKGSIVNSIEELAHIRVSEHITEILNKTNAESLSDLNIQTLKKLRNAYATVDEYEEVFKINKLIAEKSRSRKTKRARNTNPHAVSA